jgi:hypothetical protein
MVHVTSSWRSHEDEAKDECVNTMGCIEPCYPYFTVFAILCPGGISVFSIVFVPLNRTLRSWHLLTLLLFSYALLRLESVR